MKNTASLSIVLLLGCLLVLPGCGLLEWITGKKEDAREIATVPTDEMAVSDEGASCPVNSGSNNSSSDADVLVTMDGKTLITAPMFEAEFAKVLEKNPQIKQLLALMPDVEEKFVGEMINQKIIGRYIAEHKIDQSPAYQAELESMVNELKQMLNMEVFGRQFNVTVSDAEIRKFYEEHKTEIPELLISYGGTNAMGVSFDSQEEAQAFLDKVKNASKQFEKIANESGLKGNFRDFKLVNARSVAIDPTVRTKVVTIKTFPTVDIVQGGDKKYWVINALSQEEAKFRPFDEVKELLKPAIEREKQMLRIQEEYKKLMQEYNIQINKEHFAKKQNEQNKSDLMQQFMQQEEAAAQTPKAVKKSATPRVA